MSESDDYTVDVILERGRFVGVVRMRCSGAIVWRGEPRTRKSTALADAQHQKMQERTTQDDRDSKTFTMDMAADLVEQSRSDDGGLGLS